MTPSVTLPPAVVREIEEILKSGKEAEVAIRVRARAVAVAAEHARVAVAAAEATAEEQAFA